MLSRLSFGAVAAVFVTLAASAQAVAPPTLDGRIDTDYFAKGQRTDYVGFIPGADGRLFVVDDTNIDDACTHDNDVFCSSDAECDALSSGSTCTDSGFIYVAWEIAKTFNDTSYGSQAHCTWRPGDNDCGPPFGDGNGHTRFDLEESDKQRLILVNFCRENDPEPVVDIEMDILDCSGTFSSEPSGCGVSQTTGESLRHSIEGNDWSKFEFATSMTYNYNETGYCSGGSCSCGSQTDLHSDSPVWSDENDYVVEQSGTCVASTCSGGWNDGNSCTTDADCEGCDQWVTELVWEMRLARSIIDPDNDCPNDTILGSAVNPVELHASPSKPGESPVSAYRTVSTIGDYVWLDVDRDGRQDAVEPGIPNVTVELWTDPDGDGDPSDGAVIATKRTDSYGRYLFAELASGDYVVRLPQGGACNNVCTGGGGGSDDGDECTADAQCDGTCTGTAVCHGGVDDGNACSSDADCAGDTSSNLNDLVLTSGSSDWHDDDGIELGRSETYLVADFGFVYESTTLAAIGDFVWSDADNDGIQDPGEPGIGGVTVELLSDPDGDGNFDTLVATRTTGDDGLYLFTGISPGEYVVDVTDLSGVLSGYTLTSGPQSNTDPTAPITVIAGETHLQADFGYFNSSLGDIGTTIWSDLDDTGVREEDDPASSDVEPGFDEVSVALFLDDGDGVFEEDADNVVATTQTGRNCCDVSGGVGALSCDDPITRCTSDSDCGATNDTCVRGFYRFVGLALDDGGGDSDADYWVVGTDTKGIVAQLFITFGTDDTDDNSQWRQHDVALSSGTTSIDYSDFGFFFNDNERGAIGDFVWYDLNGDGVQDPLEPGAQGVTVEIYQDDDGDGTFDGGDDFVAQSITDNRGYYYFANLDLPGPGMGPMGTEACDGSTTDYHIVVTDESGVLDSYTATNASACPNPLPSQLAAGTGFGHNGCIRFDGTGLGAILSDGTVCSPGNVDLSMDFGWQASGSYNVGNVVWKDDDADGQQDAGETTFEDVTIELILDQNGNKILDGDLVEGNCCEEDSGNCSVTTGTACTEDGDCPSGETCTGVDCEPGPRLCRAHSWCDQTDSTTWDYCANLVFPDPVIGATTTTGHCCDDTLGSSCEEDGNGDPVPCDTDGDCTTGGFGTCATTYFFINLDNGDYIAQVTDENEILSNYEQTGGIDPWAFSVSNADRYDIDFGYSRTPGTGAIGDFVWLDADRDGIQDGAEDGVPGVTLDLYLDDGDGTFDAGDTLAGSTTTGALGRYLFTGLTAGTYFVDVTDTAGQLSGLTLTNETPCCDDPHGAISLSRGEYYPDADFGYHSSSGSALGDWVWFDDDQDGIQDPGEIGISGVDITVSGTGSACNPSCTTTTDAYGFYLVTGLDAGDYDVEVDESDADAQGYNIGPTNSLDFNPSTGEGATVRTIEVPANTDVLYADWGFDSDTGTLGSIGDFVWLDVDLDGQQDGGASGEDGIRDVTLDLLHDPGSGFVTIGTTTTDASGGYLFSGLPAGDYRVQVTDTKNVLGGLNLVEITPQSNTNPTATISLAAGQNHTTADFGYGPAAGTIGNFVWLDGDGDGVVDTGESGIQGVTVDLWEDINANGTIERSIDNRIRRTSTDVDGLYEFPALPLSDYIVTVSDTSGVLSGFSKTTGPSPGNDDNSQADPYSITLTSGSPNNLTADFGYRGTTFYTLSGTVFEDVDNDGDTVPTYEPSDDIRIPGISVTLYRDLDGDGVLDPGDPKIGTDVTNNDGGGPNQVGFYEFPGLPNGHYIVEVDADDSRLDGMFQTTQQNQTGDDGIQNTFSDSPAGVGAQIDNADSDDNDFGFHAPGGTQTNPVTLAYFSAEDTDGGTVRFVWATATEVGNVGFELYAVDDRGHRRRLNEQLIASALVDSAQAQSYAWQASDVEESLFVIEDVDIFGRRREHGPFRLGQAYGEPPSGSPIDWTAISTEHRQKQALRNLEESERVGAAIASSAGTGGGGAANAPTVSAVRIEVNEDGLYRITYEDFLAAGIDLAGAKPWKMALWRGDEKTPRHIETAEGRRFSRFGPGSFLEFWGEARDSLYGATNVYVLQVNRAGARRVFGGRGRVPRRIEPPATYTETAVRERNRGYSFSAPGDDPWFDTAMLVFAKEKTFTFDIEADGYVPGAGPVTVTAELWGGTDWPQDDDHHVVVRFNGEPLADEVFDGVVRHPVQATLGDDVLRNGSNTLELALPADTGTDAELVHFDRLTVTYPRAFEARDGRLDFEANARKFRVDSLPSCDVVAYRLWDRELRGHRIRRAWRMLDMETEPQPDGTCTVEIRGHGPRRGEMRYVVYAESALKKPAAIAPAREDAGPRSRDRRYDLLGGTGGYLVISHPDFIGPELDRLLDVRREQGYDVRVVDVERLYDEYSGGNIDPEAIRSYIRDAVRWLGTETVLLVGADTYDYHDYLGLDSMSFIPSLYTASDELVRFAPADALYADTDGDRVPDVAIGRLPVRTSAELAVVVDKTLVYEQKPAGRSAVFAADKTDGSVSFRRASEEMIRQVPGDWVVGRAYVQDLGGEESRRVLIEALNAGVTLTNFVGHSGFTVWTFDGLFKAADVDDLTNEGLPTVVTQWGCWNTYYVAPQENTLGHRLMLAGQQGAAAVLGPSTLTESVSDKKLGQLLFPRLMDGQALGEAILKAKQELAERRPDLEDVILGWTLLGDPAIRIVAE